MRRISLFIIAAVTLVAMTVGLTVASFASDADYTEAATILRTMQFKTSDGAFASADAPALKQEVALVLAQVKTGKTDISMWNRDSESEFFTDVVKYGSAIDYLYQAGIIDGKSATIYGYGDTVTYEEMLAYAVRILGYEADSFVYPYDYIVTAEKLGLCQSIALTDFTKPLAWGEVCQIVWDMLCTEVAVCDPASGKILFPGERGSGTTEIWRVTLLEELSFAFGKTVGTVRGFYEGDAAEGIVDIVEVEAEFDIMKIAAADLGITAETEKASYLGLEVEIYYNGHYFDQESYDDGDTVITFARLPEYTHVDNLGDDNVKIVDKSGEFYLDLGGELFNLDEYEFELMCFDPWCGWMRRDISIEQLFWEYENAIGRFSYRVVWEASNYEPGYIEILYTPFAFGQYIERELYYTPTAQNEKFVILGTLTYDETTNIDGEPSFVEERFLGGASVSKSVSAAKGEASLRVKVRGVDVNPGDFIVYYYNEADNVLTVVDNFGGIKRGGLSAVSSNRETVKIDGANYSFANGYPTDIAFDMDTVMCILDAYEYGKDNVQFIEKDGRIAWMARAYEWAEEKQYDFAIISFDGEIMTDLLGLTYMKYESSLVDGYYIEDGYVVAAMLNFESGEWELCKIGGVATDYDEEDCEFTDVVDVATLVKYAAIANLTSAKQAELDAAEAVLATAPMFTVIDEADGVYTIGEADGFIESVENADGLTFNAYGVTNKITDSWDKAAERIVTNENTVIVGIFDDGVAVRKGVQNSKKNINGTVRFFVASEELIVFSSGDYPYGWAESPSGNAAETYYTVLADSYGEYTVDGDGMYTLTIEGLFNLAELKKDSLSISSYDPYELRRIEYELYPGTVIFKDENGCVEITDRSLGEALTDTLGEDYWESVIFDFTDGETIGIKDVVHPAIAVASLEVNVINLDFSGVNWEGVDTSSLYVDFYGEETPYEVELDKDVYKLYEPCEGVLDNFIIESAGTTVRSGAEELFEVILQTVCNYDEMEDKLVVYVLKCICGSDGVYIPGEIPDWEGEPEESVEDEYDFAIVSFDREIMTEILGLTESKYESSLVDGYYIEDDYVMAAMLDLESGKWKACKIGGVAIDYDWDDCEFTDIVDVATLVKYAEIANLSDAKQAELYAAEAVLATAPMFTVVEEADGVYTIAEADGFIYGIENYNGLIFNSKGVTNKITASEDTDAVEIATNENTVVVAIGSDGVAVSKGVQSGKKSIRSTVRYFAADESLIVFACGEPVSAWGTYLDFERVEGEDAPTVSAKDYTLGIVTFDSYIMTDLLGLTDMKYESSLVDGYYIEDGCVVAAMLNLESGEWELCRIAGVATDYDEEEAEFIDIVDVATLVKYAEIANLSSAKQAELDAAECVLADGPIYAVIENANGEYIIAWGEIFDRVENVDGLLFNSSGRTNFITASEDAVAARVSTNENTVIVGISPYGGVAVRTGVQNAKVSVNAPVVFYHATDDLIIFSCGDDLYNWANVSTNTDASYYVATEEVCIEYGYLDSDYQVYLSIDGLINVETFEKESLTVIFDEWADARDLMADIEPGAMLYREGENSLCLTDLTVGEALRNILGDEYITVLVEAWDDEYSISIPELGLSRADAIGKINAKLLTLDFTCIDWSHAGGEAFFDIPYDPELDELFGNFNFITVVVDDCEYCLYDITVGDPVIELEGPEYGLFSNVELMTSGVEVHKCVGDERFGFYSYQHEFVARYDADTQVLDLYVVRILCPIDIYCGFGDWQNESTARHYRVCECGEIEYASHSYGEWTEVKAPTASADGEKVRICSDCGAKQSAAVPKLTVAYVEIESVDARAGGSVSVPVSIRNGSGFGTLEFTVCFDADVLELSDVIVDSAFSGCVVTPVSVANESGRVTFCFAYAQNNVNSGEIAALVFNVSDSGENGVTVLELDVNEDEAFYYDGESMKKLSVNTEDGAVSIFDYIPGDANSDDVVNIRDAAVVLQKVARWNVSINERAADVNRDGIVSVRDAAMIMQYLAGWDVTLGEAVSVGYASLRSRSVSALEISLTDAECKAGGVVTVDVNVNGENGIGGIEFGVDYDRALLTLTKVELASEYASAVVTPVANANESGRVSFCHAGTANVSASGRFATLTFEVSRRAKVSDITLDAECLDAFYYVGSTMESLAVSVDTAVISVTEEADTIVGDVNDDGNVDLADALLVIDALLNKKALDNADISGDGVLTLIDVMQVMKAITK